MQFTQLSTTQKGSTGEEIAVRHLREKGWTIYCNDIDGSHDIDFIGIKGEQLYMIDIKTKPRRIHYPDTGMDLADWKHYGELSKRNNVPVLILFVDTYVGTIYGNVISELQTNTEKGGIIYFPLDQMLTLAKLKEEEVTEINKHNSHDKAKYNYK